MRKQIKNVFFVGIKGVAMANLAVFLKKMGNNVSGADVDDQFITDKLLIDNRIRWQAGFDHLPKDIDLVVYSAAHQGLNNPLVKKASLKKIKIVSQAELLGQLMKQFKIKVAVSGCHGKTTTSSLLSYALNKLKVRPSYIVGTPFFTNYQGGNYQDKKYFVVEADEYGINPPQDKTPKFFKLSPDWIIATNIDFDHPDVYKNIEETTKAFVKFFGFDPDFRRDDEYSPKLILNIDDKHLLQFINRLKNKNIITYGFSNKADYQIIDWRIEENGSTFAIKGGGRFKIALFGKHNIANATAVIVQLIKLGFKVSEIKKAILGFNGAKRRFEFVDKKNNIYLFDDYAHHPAEIKATIQAARERFPKKRLIIIFQPHTYSRTQSLFSDFAKALSLADFSLLLPIFPSAREKSVSFSISSQDIVNQSAKKNLFAFDSKEELLMKLKTLIKPNDLIFTMGAGDVYQLKDDIIKIMANDEFIK